MDYRHMATMAAMVEREALRMGPLIDQTVKAAEDLTRFSMMGPLIDQTVKAAEDLTRFSMMGPLIDQTVKAAEDLTRFSMMGPLIEREALRMGSLIDQTVKAAEDSTRFSMLERSIPDRARRIPTSTSQNRDQQTIKALKIKVANLNRENEILIEENALLDEPPRLKCDDDDWV